MYVTGYSGTGKTSFVHLVKKTLDVYFISGKFTVGSNTPYSALIEAVNSLIEQVKGLDNPSFIYLRCCLKRMQW